MPTRGEVAASYDAIAAEFDASRDRPWPETVAFARELPPTSRVLDLGCGGGRNLRFLKEGGHRVVGLDASAGLLARATAKVGRRSLIRGDIVSLPFRSAAFDAAHCVAALHHLPSGAERRQSVREIARVLRPGAVALLSVWAREQDRFRSMKDEDTFVPWRRSDGTAIARFYHPFRAGELEALVSAANLSAVRAWREGDNHVVLARPPKRKGT